MDADEDALTIASNAAADLVRVGKLDEAEKAANDLLVQFPEVHDGYDRLGMVHEARGDNRTVSLPTGVKRLPPPVSWETAAANTRQHHLPAH
jgi:predicted Zn-dependent protease